MNPTFTWVRLAQPIPVRVRPTQIPPDVLVSAGMTCTVVLKDGAHLQIGASAKRLFAVLQDWFAGQLAANARTPTKPRLLAVFEIEPRDELEFGGAGVNASLRLPFALVFALGKSQ